MTSGIPALSPEPLSLPPVALGSLPHPAGNVVYMAGGSSSQSSSSATVRCSSLSVASRLFTVAPPGQVQCAHLVEVSVRPDPHPCARHASSRTEMHRPTTACGRPDPCDRGPCCVCAPSATTSRAPAAPTAHAPASPSPGGSGRPLELCADSSDLHAGSRAPCPEPARRIDPRARAEIYSSRHQILLPLR